MYNPLISVFDRFDLILERARKEGDVMIHKNAHQAMMSHLSNEDRVFAEWCKTSGMIENTIKHAFATSKGFKEVREKLSEIKPFVDYYELNDQFNKAYKDERNRYTS